MIILSFSTQPLGLELINFSTGLRRTGDFKAPQKSMPGIMGPTWDSTVVKQGKQPFFLVPQDKKLSRADDSGLEYAWRIGSGG